MQKPTEEKVGEQPKRFPRKVTHGIARKQGRAKRRMREHAMK